MSKPAGRQAVVAAARVLDEEFGWTVRLDATVGASGDRWGAAASAQVRAGGLSAMLCSDVDAVFCAAGGHHAGELLEHLDVAALVERRNLGGRLAAFVGTSDNTIVALTLASAGLTAFCGPDLASDGGCCRDVQLGSSRPFDFVSSRTAVRTMFHPGRRQLVAAPLLEGWSGAVADRGPVSGRLVPVNLPSLLRLAGTRWWPADLLEGAVLVVERDGLSPDAVVADLVQLANIGVFDQVVGLGFGWLEGLPAGGFGPVAAAAADLCAGPVWKMGVFGHRCPHLMLPVGAGVEVSASGLMLVDWPAC